VKAALVNRLAARTHEPLKTMHEVPRPMVGKFASQGV
jgi:biopolymer transport protein ExbB